MDLALRWWWWVVVIIQSNSQDARTSFPATYANSMATQNSRQNERRAKKKSINGGQEWSKEREGERTTRG